MIVPTKTFVPREQFDLDIILKVIADIFYLNLAKKCQISLIKAERFDL